MHVPLHQASGLYCHFPQCVFLMLDWRNWLIHYMRKAKPTIGYLLVNRNITTTDWTQWATYNAQTWWEPFPWAPVDIQPTNHSLTLYYGHSWHHFLSFTLSVSGFNVIAFFISVIQPQKEKKNDISEYIHLGVLAQIPSKLGQRCCFWTRVWLDFSVPLEPNKKRGRTIGMTSLISG